MTAPHEQPLADAGNDVSVLVGIPGPLRDLYTTVARFESLFPGRPFTAVGHLGEMIAAHRHALILLSCSTRGYDVLVV